MAHESVSSRVAAATPTSFLVYTVPLGKSALIIGLAIANVHTADLPITVKWTDESAAVGGTEYTLANAVVIRPGETWYPLMPNINLNENDALQIQIPAPGTGILDVSLSLDVTP